MGEVGQGLQPAVRAGVHVAGATYHAVYMPQPVALRHIFAVYHDGAGDAPLKVMYCPNIYCLPRSVVPLDRHNS